MRQNQNGDLGALLPLLQLLLRNGPYEKLAEEPFEMPPGLVRAISMLGLDELGVSHVMWHRPGTFCAEN